MASDLHPVQDDPMTAVASPGGGCSAEQFAQESAAVYPALWTLARSMTRTAEDAEDIVQEALLTGLGKRGGFTPGTSFLAWMGTIVRWTAMNRYRYESRRQHAPLDGIQEPASAATASPAREHAEIDPASGKLVDDQTQSAFDDVLTKALDQLSEVARGCLMLRTQHDLDYQSISEVMGIPANTAMSHVHRSRRVLRDQLRSMSYAFNSSRTEGGLS